MPYALAWTTQARDKSAKMWLDLWLSDPATARRFSSALNWLDQELRAAPQQGQRRGTGFVMLRDPVEVVYSFSQVSYSVTITDVDLIAPSATINPPIP